MLGHNVDPPTEPTQGGEEKGTSPSALVTINEHGVAIDRMQIAAKHYVPRRDHSDVPFVLDSGRGKESS